MRPEHSAALKKLISGRWIDFDQEYRYIHHWKAGKSILAPNKTGKVPRAQRKRRLQQKFASQHRNKHMHPEKTKATLKKRKRVSEESES